MTGDREMALKLMERLAAVGVDFTLRAWRTYKDFDMVGRHKSEWDGPMAYSVCADNYTMPAEGAEQVIAIAREFGLQAWFSHEGVSLEAPSKSSEAREHRFLGRRAT